MSEQSPTQKAAIALKKNAIIFGVSLVVLIISRFALLTAFAVIAVAVTGWLLVFYGASLASYRLTGRARRNFNIAVSLIVPLLMSLYFVKDVTHPSPGGLFGILLYPWLWVMAAVLAALAWAAADQLLDVEHPCRAFLGASVIVWVILCGGYNGIHYGDNDDWLYSGTDDNYVAVVHDTGRVFGQYLVYIAATYAAMYVNLRKHRRAQASARQI